MARIFNTFLYINTIIIKCLQGLRPRQRHLDQQVILIYNLPYTPAPSSRGCLQHKWIPVFPAKISGFFYATFSLGKVSRTRNDRYARLFHNPSGNNLVAQIMNNIGRGTDKIDTSLFTGTGKIGVLRQKSIPGMYRVGAALTGRPYHPVNIKIIPPRPIAYHDSIIRRSDKQRFVIRTLVNGYSPESKFLNRPNQSQGYFTPVCNQNFIYLFTCRHLHCPSR